MSIETWIFDIGKKALKPDPYLQVSEWADEKRTLSKLSSAEPGPWRTSRTPYLKMPMDCLSALSPWNRVVLMGGSQFGKTEAGFNWIGYIIDHAPGPLLHVMPTVDIAKDQSKTRIAQMIEDCQAIKDKVREEKSRDGGNAMLMKLFDGGFWGMTGANSPASLRSKPIRYLFLDEVDTYPGDVGGEGDPVNLAIVRTRNFKNRKIFEVSSPKISGKSRIERDFNESMMHFYYVPCPHCESMQSLKWKNVKWEHGKPETAWYECEHCGEKIYNFELMGMLEKGEWRALNKDYVGDTIGFHLSALYSPWFTWSAAVKQFLEAKTPELLQVFINTVLGESWQERGEVAEWKDLYLRRESYEIGTVPEGGLILVAGADVQKDRIEAQVLAYGRMRECWVVDYQVFMGDTADLNSQAWKQLDTLMMENFKHEAGKSMQIKALAIDTGYKANTVYQWARRYPVGKVFAIKGQGSLPVMVGNPRAVDVEINGKKKYRALKLFTLGVDVIKAETMGLLNLPKPEKDQRFQPGFIHFPELAEDYFKMLCSETQIKKVVKGKTHYEWIKLRERNEALDTFVYGRGVASAIGIDKLTSYQWEEIEKMIFPKGKVRANSPIDEAMLTRTKPKAKRRVFSKGVSA